MSYNNFNQGGGGGFGGRKRYRDDDYSYSSPDRSSQFRRTNDYRGGRGGRGRGGHGGGRQFHEEKESPETIFKRTVWRAGDQVVEEGSSLPSSYHFGQGPKGLVDLARLVTENWYKNQQAVLTCFRIAVSELPHKINHFAALLCILAFEPSSQASDVDSKSIAQEIVQDLLKSLQSNIDSRQWRCVRFLMQLFATLASLPTKLVPSDSFISLLSSFASVLDEPGVRIKRGDEFVRIVTDSLFRFIPEDDQTGFDQIVATLASYAQESRNLDTSFVVDSFNADFIDDPIMSVISVFEGGYKPYKCFALDVLKEAKLDDNFFGPSSTFTQPIEFPNILVPPDDDGASLDESFTHAESSTDSYASKGYFGVYLYPKIFNDETVPLSTDPSGMMIRSLIIDTVDVFVMNRKECARILLDLVNFLPPGTFTNSQNESDDNSSTWILQHIIMNTILSCLFVLPEPHHKSVYYQSLITELCRLSPSTVAPAMGKSVRRLYQNLGLNNDDNENERSCIKLKNDGIRRFADWFAVHLSNFSFQWRWREWENELANLEKNHPKYVFVFRVLQLENRLSYHERVKQTLPDSFFEEHSLFSAQQPTFSFKLDDEEHEHHEIANEFLKLLKDKANDEDLKSDLEMFEQKLQDKGSSKDESQEIAASVLLQCLLYVGSRSLSHLLNIIERYLGVFRDLCSSQERRIKLLNIVSECWSENEQMISITIDKLLQYRIVDPSALVSFVFENTSGDSPSHTWSQMIVWDILKAALDRAKSRVQQLKSRLELLRQTEEAKAEADKAAGKTEEREQPAELKNAERQLANFTSEYENVFIDTVRQFNVQLEQSPSLHKGLERFWFENWFRQFCITYSWDIKTLKDLISQSVDLPSESLVSTSIASAQKWSEYIS